MMYTLSFVHESDGYILRDVSADTLRDLVASFPLSVYVSSLCPSFDYCDTSDRENMTEHGANSFYEVTLDAVRMHFALSAFLESEWEPEN